MSLFITHFLFVELIDCLYRLFFGGYHPIKITSIRLIKDNKNFESIIGALYYLDMVISGMYMSKIRENAKWIAIIKYLFDVLISKKEEDIIKYDNYIYSTFACFVKQKTKLEFHISQISNYCSEDFRNLIIGEFKEIDPQETDIVTIRSMINDGDIINFPKKEIFNVFHNVEESGLSLFSRHYLYPISLSSLLPIIKSNPSLKLIRILLVNSPPGELYGISTDLRAKYENAGYSIHLEEKKGLYYGSGIYCIIKNKN